MKIISLIISTVFLISCNTSEKKNTETNTTAQETTSVSKTKENSSQEGSNTLQQNGDYSSLFNRERKNCDFIASETLAAAIQVPASTIAIENECTYNLTEANGNKTRFHFKIESWDTKKVNKEIKTVIKNAKMFGENSTLSQYRISETGDTYLSMHQNRMVRIINEVNSNVIVLFYTPEIAPDESDIKKIKDLKATARERAYSLSNFLLKEYKK